jgi:flagellar basal-body rod protein FlgB
MSSLQSTDTVAAVSAALDAATIRQRVISSNIANASTPGSQAVRVKFDAAIADASAPTGAGAVTLRPVFSLDAQPVQVDQEVAAMSQNAAHYQALIRGLNKHFALISAAISDGRR